MIDKAARFLFIVGCILLFASCNETDPNWYYGYWFSGEKSIIISQPDKIQLNNIMSESVYNATFWSVGDALFVQTGKEQLTLELNPKKKTISLSGDVYEHEGATALNSLYPWLLGKWSSGGHANSPSLVISPTQISYLDENGKVLSKGKYSIKQGEYDYEAKLSIKWNHPNDVREVRLFIPQESLMVSSDNNDSLGAWFKISNTESSAQAPSSSSNHSTNKTSTTRSNASSTNTSQNSDKFKVVGEWVCRHGKTGDLNLSQEYEEGVRFNSDMTGVYNSFIATYRGLDRTNRKRTGSFTFTWDIVGNNVYITLDGERSQAFTYSMYGTLTDSGGNTFTRQ